MILTRLGDDLYDTARGQFAASETPAIGVQLARVIGDAARDGFRLVEQRSLNLRGFGPPSRVLLFRPDRFYQPVSDEIRIYDEEDGVLVERFAFRPTPAFEPRNDPQFLANVSVFEPYRSLWQDLADRAFVFRPRFARDIDGAPGDELVGDIAEVGMLPIFPRPVIVRWDAARTRYRVTPLLSPAAVGPGGMRGRLTRRFIQPGDFAQLMIDTVYSPARVIVNATGNHERFRAYAVEDYAAIVLNDSGFDPRGSRPAVELLAGYIVRGSGHANADLLQLIEWHIEVFGDHVEAVALPSRPEFLQLYAFGTVESVLADMVARRSTG